MRRFLPTVASLAALAFSHTLMAQPRSSCEAVYANAVRDVHIETRIATEHSVLFNEHCERNGSLRQSSTSLDLTIPYKSVEVGFNGTRDEARSKMQAFCKTQSNFLMRFEDVYRNNSPVVVDALKSFNQCRDLEIRGVSITHANTETRAVVIGVSFNPAVSKVALTGVLYDPDVADCTSTIFPSGQATRVDASTGRIEAQGPFSVACTRKAAGTAAGMLKFPRLELLIDTSQGPYTFSMPTEEMYGYDTANRTRQAAELAASEKRELIMQNASLRKQMERATVTTHYIVKAKGWAVGCKQSVDDATRNACGEGNTRTYPVNVRTQNGGECGKNTFQYYCVRYK
jgi:hypothetical protein